MKKLTAILCLAALLLSCFAGCAKTETPAPTAAPTQAPAAETTAPTTAPTEAPEEPVTVRLGALTGPTAMGMVKLLKDSDQGESRNRYEYELVGAADELTPKIIKGELDIASVPANLASVIYNKTQGKVKAIAVNVLGVLYIGEYNTQQINSVADLKGKTIYATGAGSTPEYFLRYLLTQNGLDPDKDVTLEWKSKPDEVVGILKNEGEGVAMLPQPYATAAGVQMGEGFRLALSLSDEWAALDNGSQCTTACILVQSQFAQEHPEAVDTFLEEFAASAAWVNEDVPEAAGYCEEYGIIKAPIAQKALPKCNIVCITGKEMKAALSGCLGVLFEQNPASVGGAMPGDDYFYGAN